MILNQWLNPRCTGYALLGALQYIDPTIDIAWIIPKLNESTMITVIAAKHWFQQAWLIEDLRPISRAQAKILLRRGVPVITSANYIDWQKTGQSPYHIVWTDDNKDITGHAFFAKEKKEETPLIFIAKFQNSWGEEWGDKWYFYGNIDDKRFWQFFQIIPKKNETHNSLLKKYIGNRVDVDSKFWYQCVDWVRAYNNSRKRPITNYGNAIDLWIRGLWPKWQRVEKKDFNSPSEGDVICWGTTWWEWYGHIAIANAYCLPAGVMRYVDQNGWKGTGSGLGDDAIQNRWGTYSWVLGWFKWRG